MEIMLLGTFHLSENTDSVQLGEEERSKFGDEQFESLIEELAKFEPEQIFVEYPIKLQEQLDKEYLNYQATNTPVENNEIYQIGFRLAKRLQHDKVFAVDWNEDLPNVPYFDTTTNEQSKIEIQGITERAAKQIEMYAQKIKSSTIIDTFKFINSQEQTKIGHQTYVELMLLEDEITFNWVSNYWYYRNLKIVKNINAAKLDGKNKALVLYGAGHNYLLHNFLGEMPGYQVKFFGEE